MLETYSTPNNGIASFAEAENFSIFSKDIGVMSVLMEGCNCKIQEKNGQLCCGRVLFLHFY